MKITHQVPADTQPVRLDRYLADALQVSRARVMDAFALGLVRVNGKRARKGDHVVPDSEVVAEIAGELGAPDAQSELPLRILVEDPALLVLDKPAFMASHPLTDHEKGTLANALIARFPECAQASLDPRECGLVHRLDVETSGALVAARNRKTYQELRQAFSSRLVNKRYLALVGGAPGEGGEIEIPLAHHPRNPRKMVACALDEDADRLKARPALTRYRTVERLGDFSLVEVQIPTGVMHQIRVHLAAIGAPVAGDTLYQGPVVANLSRQFLHAAQVDFAHPETGKQVTAVSPLPAELELVLTNLRAAADASTV